MKLIDKVLFEELLEEQDEIVRSYFRKDYLLKLSFKFFNGLKMASTINAHILMK
jgi:hypothetical protein